jgi:hypothetical protein
MAPAAKPKPYGNTLAKRSTKRNAGTAVIGCGNEEKMLQPTQAAKLAPRGRSTALMAKPSGMLCTAIAIVIAAASESPPPKDTPTAAPSAKECTVMTTTINSIRRALTPVAPTKLMS